LLTPVRRSNHMLKRFGHQKTAVELPAEGRRTPNGMPDNHESGGMRFSGIHRLPRMLRTIAQTAPSLQEAAKCKTRSLLHLLGLHPQLPSNLSSSPHLCVCVSLIRGMSLSSPCHFACRPCQPPGRVGVLSHRSTTHITSISSIEIRKSLTFD
jgi:hypothetical protein